VQSLGSEINAATAAVCLAQCQRRAHAAHTVYIHDCRRPCLTLVRTTHTGTHIPADHTIPYEKAIPYHTRESMFSLTLSRLMLSKQQRGRNRSCRPGDGHAQETTSQPHMLQYSLHSQACNKQLKLHKLHTDAGMIRLTGQPQDNSSKKGTLAQLPYQTCSA
jgi:hypothetical protein